MSERLTAGARRVFEQLHTQLNNENGTGTTASFFRELLLVLIAIEGEAEEILRTANVSRELIEAHDWEDLEADPSNLELEITRKADHFAIQTTTESVTGTEHLLLAIIALDESTAKLLHACGVDFETVFNQIAQDNSQLPAPSDQMIQIRSADPGILNGAGLERTLDASANRCREGLRVVEDFVRFQLDDPFLSKQLKQLRHQLTTTLSHLGQQNWVRARDTSHDVGTQTSTASEVFRGSALDVLRASLKRVEEALRSLEEYSKLIDVELSQRLEQCRYHFYTIEKAIEANMNSRTRLHTARLYLLVTDELCRYGAEKTIRNSIQAGVDVVQIREKSMTDADLIRYAQHVRQWTREADVIFIMNDRVDIASIVDADGVHLGQDDASVHQARKILGGDKLIGVSTHHIEQANQAVLDGADYLGVGPVFESGTKSFTEFSGLDYVEEISQDHKLPWFAIGGIDQTNLGQVMQAGATRVALSGAICQAAHPKGVAAQIAEQLKPRTP